MSHELKYKLLTECWFNLIWDRLLFFGFPAVYSELCISCFGSHIGAVEFEKIEILNFAFGNLATELSLLYLGTSIFLIKHFKTCF